MRYVYENRAALVLYKFLRSNPRDGDYLLPANVCPIVVAVFLKGSGTFSIPRHFPKDIMFGFRSARRLAAVRPRTDRRRGIRSHIRRVFRSFGAICCD